MWKKFNFSWSNFVQRWKNRKYHPKELAIGNELYIVRLVKITDIKELISIQRDVYDGYAPWEKSAFVSELYSDFPHLYLLAEKEREILGFIGCRIYRNDAHITNIAVKRVAQGKGIGSFFIQEIKWFALEIGCQQLSLEVRLSNKTAQSLYRKNGFISKKIHPNYYKEDSEDAVEMVLSLEDM